MRSLLGSIATVAALVTAGCSDTSSDEETSTPSSSTTEPASALQPVNTETASESSESPEPTRDRSEVPADALEPVGDCVPDISSWLGDPPRLLAVSGVPVRAEPVAEIVFDDFSELPSAATIIYLDNVESLTPGVEVDSTLELRATQAVEINNGNWTAVTDLELDTLLSFDLAIVIYAPVSNGYDLADADGYFGRAAGVASDEFAYASVCDLSFTNHTLEVAALAGQADSPFDFLLSTAQQRSDTDTLNELADEARVQS